MLRKTATNLICRLIVFSIPLTGWVAAQSLHASDNAAVEAAIATIEEADLRAHVEVLADDSLEGREAGTRGGQAAAKYLALLFEKHGLEPAGDGESFYQSFGNGYRNILGMIPGSDAEVGDEIVVIGAHYDHVGYGTRRNSFGPYGAIHNGADDNASGTSAVIEIIEAFQQLPAAPRRTILFALWDGEEKGLLGSKHWLASPTRDLKQVKFSINLDMIGRLRPEGLYVYGERTSRELRQFLSRQNKSSLKLAFTWELKGDSDHYPFIERRIPTVMMHTGLHGEYHRPSDDIDTLNYPGIEDVSRYVARVALEVADRQDAFEFYSRAWSDTEASRSEFERQASAFQTRLGVAVSPVPGGQGVMVDEVLAGSPADRAGLQRGMIFESAGGDEIKSEPQFWNAVFAAERELELVIEDADGDVSTKQIQLGGEPLRIGLSWRIDRGQDGVALISRVSRHSRADRAGLAVGQRIYSVNGTKVTDDQALQQAFSSATDRIEIEAEKDGKVATYVIEF